MFHLGMQIKWKPILVNMILNVVNIDLFKFNILFISM